MLQFATHVPGHREGAASGGRERIEGRAASVSTIARPEAQVQRSNIFRRVLKGSPIGFDSQITGPARRSQPPDYRKLQG